MVSTATLILKLDIRRNEWSTSRSGRFTIVYHEPKDGCVLIFQKRVKSLAPGGISKLVACSLH